MTSPAAVTSDAVSIENEYLQAYQFRSNISDHAGITNNYNLNRLALVCKILKVLTREPTDGKPQTWFGESVDEVRDRNTTDREVGGHLPQYIHDEVHYTRHHNISHQKRS